MTNPLVLLLNAVFGLVRFVFTTLASVFGSSTSSSAHLTAHLHASHILLYRGPHTYVPITLLADDAAAAGFSKDDLKITLIQKGYRAGLVGWSAARFLGDVSETGLDVTPASYKSWDGDSASTASSTQSEKEEEDQDSTLSTPTLSSRRRSKIESEVKSLLPSIPHKDRLALLYVRIPVRSGDGYFRLKIKTKRHAVYTPTVRILSISLSSASIRGASVLPPTIVPELLIRSLSVAATTALFALFPVAALLEKVLPSKWTRKFMGWLYRKLGMEDRQRAFMDKHGQKVSQAKRKALETVPFATLGVRTSLEIEKDDQVGQGGVIYHHTS